MRVHDTMKRSVRDFLYSFVAYALPTFVLQFVILPLIAKRLSSEDNGLFLALFNAVRLCVSLFVVPLASIRLLQKKECIAEPKRERGFNFLFALVTAISAALMVLLGFFYYGKAFSVFHMLRLFAVLLLLAAHDYYSIAFRINLTYKLILIDNLMIVVGYLLGIGLMLKFGYWELVFIGGYSFGLAYTMAKSKLWRGGIGPVREKKTISEYGQLSVSSGLNNATVYCDKMLIYPLIGGYSVSVYNAAAVVSKLMSLVSVPLRNVFLSYIVDVDKVSVSGKRRGKIAAVILGGSAVLYGGFYLASVILCKILYPQYFAAALGCIPIILLAILLETYAGFLKVYLLRFEKPVLQVIASGAKVGIYLLSVLLFNAIFQFGLMGFCVSILIADFAHFVLALFYFVKNLRNNREDKEYVS